MNHQPFEEWLLSDDPLDAEQDDALRRHLATCAYCSHLAQAWGSVGSLLRTQATVAPAAGFTDRWQLFREEKKVQEHILHQKRVGRWLLFLTAGGALALFILLNLSALQRLPTPGEIFTRALFNASLLFAAGFQYLGLAKTISRIVPFPIPLIVWINLASTFVALCFIWIVSVFRLPNSKRSVRE